MARKDAVKFGCKGDWRTEDGRRWIGSHVMQGERRAQIAAALSEGTSIRAIASLFETSPGAVRRVRRLLEQGSKR